MMGTSHAATGLLTGAALGAVLGNHPADLVLCAAVGAGAALLPDLDEPNSSVGRSLAPITEGISHLTRGLSRLVYRWTATSRDSAGHDEGGHRHLTHTLPAAAGFGALAWLLASSGLWGAPVLVWLMTALGIGVIWREVTGQSRARATPAILSLALLAATLTYLVATTPHLVGADPRLFGITVGVGALVHILGDWLTPAGVPLAWPLKYRGKRWWMFHSPLPFATGRQSAPEWAIRVLCLLGTPAIWLWAYTPAG